MIEFSYDLPKKEAVKLAGGGGLRAYGDEDGLNNDDAAQPYREREQVDELNTHEIKVRYGRLHLSCQAPSGPSTGLCLRWRPLS